MVLVEGSFLGGQSSRTKISNNNKNRHHRHPACLFGIVSGCPSEPATVAGKHEYHDLSSAGVREEDDSQRRPADILRHPNDARKKVAGTQDLASLRSIETCEHVTCVADPTTIRRLYQQDIPNGILRSNIELRNA